MSEPSQEKQSFFGIIGGNPKLSYPGAERDRKFPFLVAQLDYEPENPFHSSILRTIYHTLEGCGGPCPRIGPHWELIGFQGLDPRTDLNRSMKMFANLQVRIIEHTTPHHTTPGIAYVAFDVYLISLRLFTFWKQSLD